MNLYSYQVLLNLVLTKQFSELDPYGVGVWPVKEGVSDAYMVFNPLLPEFFFS